MKKIDRIRLMLFRFKKDGARKRGDYIRNHHLFHSAGNNLIVHSRKGFGESYMISTGDNVIICDGVNFVTHDICLDLFKLKGIELNSKCELYMDKITIGSNVMLGGNSSILLGSNIGDNVIVGYGSVVTGNIPSNSVVAGVPAKVICSFDDFVQKRLKQIEGRPFDKSSLEEIEKYFW